MAQSALAVVLLLLALHPQSISLWSFGQGYSYGYPTQTQHNPEKEVKDLTKELLIYTKVIQQENIWHGSLTVYVAPKKGFEGVWGVVTVAVTHNAGDPFKEWFPINYTCFTDDSRWWKMKLTLLKHSNTHATLNLTAHKYNLIHEINTGSKLLLLKSLSLFARGPSQWSLTQPSNIRHILHVLHTISLPSDSKPTGYGSDSGPRFNTDTTPQSTPFPITRQSTPHTPSPTTPQPHSHPANAPATPAPPVGALTPTLVGVGVLVVIVMMVTLFVWRRRRQGQENTAASVMTKIELEGDNVVRNSLYEPFEMSSVGLHSGQDRQWQDTTSVNREQIYENVDYFQHDQH